MSNCFSLNLMNAEKFNLGLVVLFGNGAKNVEFDFWGSLMQSESDRFYR